MRVCLHNDFFLQGSDDYTLHAFLYIRQISSKRMTWNNIRLHLQSANLIFLLFVLLWYMYTGLYIKYILGKQLYMGRACDYVFSGICAQRRPRSACASAKSD